MAYIFQCIAFAFFCFADSFLYVLLALYAATQISLFFCFVSLVLLTLNTIFLVLYQYL